MIAYLIGTYTAGKLDVLIDGFLKIAKLYGPFVAYAVIITFVFIGGGFWLIKEIIRGKNGEIERLVEERNKLQNISLKKRISS